MNIDQKEALSQLRQMDEFAFERFIADLWESDGWSTTVTSGSGDRGIDVIAEKNNPVHQKQLIQVKRYAKGNKIGSPDVQQYSSLRYQQDGVDSVVIVTTSSFTKQAEQMAKELDVKLLNGDLLYKTIRDLNAWNLIDDLVAEAENSSQTWSLTTEIEELLDLDRENVNFSERQRLRTALDELRIRRGGTTDEHVKEVITETMEQIENKIRNSK